LEGKKIVDPLAHHLRMLEMVAQEAADFDIIHFHIDYLHFPITRRQRFAAVTTLHGRLDIPDVTPLFREYKEMNLISISDAQRAPMKWANWIATIHHGLPENLYTPKHEHGTYLAFLGRISPEKRVDRAIEVARRVGMPIKIAAKIDAADREYYEANIRKLMDDPLVEFVGEIGQHEKNEFLCNAYALMFLIDWQEPFGLVLTEAMACGTPVIAYGMGSVRELIDEGVTGYIVDSVQDAVNMVPQVAALDRQLIRKVFEKRFSVRRMCDDYVIAYRNIMLSGPSGIPKEPLSFAA
jgi:glycosyltransferase involved in cell wall biosynthesis